MALLSSLAEQMALVLENARLEAALARQRRESEELARVARLVSERLDVAAAGAAHRGQRARPPGCP